MPLTVLNVASPLAPVGPDAVGGAEQVLSALDAALVAAGHRSLVVACEGSQCAGELFPTPRPKGPLDMAARRRAWAHQREVLSRLLATEAVDVVHLHGADFHHSLPEPGQPTLVTLHQPPGGYPSHVFRLARPHTYLHCVSDSQRRACPPEAVLLEEVPYGVSLTHLHPQGPRDDYALLLGRICPEKGVHLALEAAHRAGMRLLIGGQVFAYPEHERYFREQVAPLLDRRRRFLGPVGLARKATLLARARCVVVPSLVPEAGSLVAMEALASGTPVVAFREGALPDLVEEGRTGFLVDSGEALAEAMEKAVTLRAEDCRRVAEARFALEPMCERYLSLYARLAHRPSRRPPPMPPLAVGAQEGPLRWDVLTHVEQLSTLREPWRALWERCPDATVFQRPEWLLPWCTRLFRGELHTLALWRGQQLVGLLPFHRRREGERRVLSFLGAGVSDYQDVLLDPALGERGREALVEGLLRRRDAWDALELSELRADSPLLSLVLPQGWRREVEAQEGCPALVLPPDTHTLEQVVPARMAGNLRTAWRRAAQLGRVEVEEAKGDGLEGLLGALLRLHGARGRARGGEGVLDEAAVQAFHREAARGLLARGALALYGLRINRRLVSAFYGFWDRQALRYYLGGFLPDFARAGVGALVVGHALTQAQARGLQLFDFLRGRETYKYAWGAEDRPLYRLRLTHRPRVAMELPPFSPPEAHAHEGAIG